MLTKTSHKHPGINPLHLLAGLLATGLSVPALLGQSVPFPTYAPGPQTNGTFVVSDGTIITPAGTQLNLGTKVRAKAIALNPLGNHTAAVLVMGTSNRSVEVFNTQTGAILQSYAPAIGGSDPDGSNLASPIHQTASTCCSARTAIPSMAASKMAASLALPASVLPACSQTTPTSAFRWTSTPPTI